MNYNTISRMKVRTAMRPLFVNILNKIDEASRQSLDIETKNEFFLAKMMILELIANGHSTMEEDIVTIYDKLLIDELEELEN